jgi:hypothetical protein
VKLQRRASATQTRALCSGIGNYQSSRATKTIHGIIIIIVVVVDETIAEVKGGAEITLESFARAPRDFVLPIFIRRFASR